MAYVSVTGSKNLDDASLLAAVNGDFLDLQKDSTLTINSDTRWNQNGAIVQYRWVGAGTTTRIDGRSTRWLSFTSDGSGVVPTLGALGSNTMTGGTSGAAGEYLGIWTALGAAPLNAGATMPTSGWIKFRTLTGHFYAGETVSGLSISVTAAAPDEVGWIQYVGIQATLWDIDRSATVEVLGDWFELGLTNGNRGQTFQHYVADWCPAIWVETGPGTDVFEPWASAGVATGTWGTTYMGTHQFTKFFEATIAGLIRIGADASANAIGFLPPAGCRVRVPNVHISCATTAAYGTNYTQIGTSAANGIAIRSATNASIGTFVFDKVSAPWLGFDRSANIKSFTINYLSTVWVFQIKDYFGPVSIKNLVVANAGSWGYPSKYYLEGCTQGGVIEDCLLTCGDGGIQGSSPPYIKYSPNISIKRSVFASMRKTGYWPLSLQNTRNILIEDCTFIGNGAQITTCDSITFKNTAYCESLAPTRPAGNNTCFDMQGGGSSNITFDGLSFPVAGFVPYYVFRPLGATNLVIKNIGTFDDPLACGNVVYNFLKLEGTNAGVLLERVFVSGLNLRFMEGNTSYFESDVRLVDVRVMDYSKPLVGTSPRINGYAIKGGSGTSLTGATNSGCAGAHFFHGFTGPTTSVIHWIPTDLTTVEPSLGTLEWVVASIPPRFKDGTLFLEAVGDYLIVTWPWKIYGMSSVRCPSNGVFYAYEIDVDNGSGFSGVWKVYGDGDIPTENGFGLKIKVRKFSASTTSTINTVNITGVTSTELQRTLYATGSLVPVSLTGLQPGTEVRIYRASDGEELDGSGSESSGSSHSYNHMYTGDLDVNIVLHHLNYQYLRYDGLTIKATGLSVPVVQQRDRNYLNP